MVTLVATLLAVLLSVFAVSSSSSSSFLFAPVVASTVISPSPSFVGAPQQTVATDVRLISLGAPAAHDAVPTLAAATHAMTHAATTPRNARPRLHPFSPPTSSPITPTTPITYEQVRGKPYTVSYDARSFLINGERVLLQAGEMHYPRSTPAMWPSLMQLTRAAGLNTIQVYIFWDIHEEQPGQYDFATFNRNLPLFLQFAQDAGLFVLLRIGPYACAEWRYGAMPMWLRTNDVVVRSMDPRWLSHMQSFVTKVIEVTEPFLARNGGPMIVAQIENEYGSVEQHYPDGHEYLQWCSNLTVQLNISLPWVMCATTDIPDYILSSCDDFYCADWISGHRSQFPDQPSMWAENYNAWFQAWGEAKPQRPVEDLAYGVSRFIANGGSYHSYYMWHGGTTFGRKTGGPNIVTSYNYDAPLDEFGDVHPIKYAFLTALHNVFINYSYALLSNDIAVPQTPCDACEVYVYGNASTNGIAFLANTDSSSNYTIAFGGKSFEVNPWSVVIVDIASLNVVFRTDDTSGYRAVAAATASAAAVPAASASGASGASAVDVIDDATDGVVMDALAPTSVQLDNLAYFIEPVGIYDPSTAITATSPLEQITTTLDSTDYLWYVTHVTLTPAQIAAGKVTLTLANCGDMETIFFNGVYVALGQFITDAQSFVIPVSGLLPGLPYALQIMSATIGVQNYGAYLNEVTRGLVGTVQLDGVDLTQQQQQWYHQIGVQGEALGLYTADNGWYNSAWTSVSAGASAPIADRMWYRFTIDTPVIHTPTGAAPYPTFQLYTAGLGKGIVWFNGFDLGRYWNITASTDTCHCTWRGGYDYGNCRYDCGVPSQSVLHVPVELVKPAGQANQIVVWAERAGDPTTVTLTQRN